MGSEMCIRDSDKAHDDIESSSARLRVALSTEQSSIDADMAMIEELQAFPDELTSFSTTSCSLGSALAF